MRAVAPRAAIARFATHRSAILRAQFLMRPVDMDKVVAFGGSQRVLGKCCIWLTRMQAMRMRLNQRWFDSRAVQATLALCVALLPELTPEQLCSSAAIAASCCEFSKSSLCTLMCWVPTDRRSPSIRGRPLCVGPRLPDGTMRAPRGPTPFPVTCLICRWLPGSWQCRLPAHVHVCRL